MPGVLKDGGERVVYAGGALREPPTGKGRYDLISPFAIHRIARHYENGAVKYADRNWEKGIPFGRCLDAMARHLNQYRMGDRAEDHLAAIAWGACAIMHYEAMGMTDLDDIPHYMDTLDDENRERIIKSYLTGTPASKQLEESNAQVAPVVAQEVVEPQVSNQEDKGTDTIWDTP